MKFTSILLVICLFGGQESLLVRSENHHADNKPDDDSFWQCALDSKVVTSNEPHLKTALLKFASSFDIKTKVTSKSVHIHVDFSQDTRQELAQACSIAGGYYAEANHPIVCTSENPQVGGTVVQTMVGAANCAAATDACRSSDIVLDGLKEMYHGLGGKCAYQKEEQRPQQQQQHHALRGTKRFTR